MDKLNLCYKKNNLIVSRRIADEYILVPMKQNAADIQSIFTLNDAAAFIWEYINGRNTLDEIKEEMVKHYAVEPGEAEKDLLNFISQLESVNAVYHENGKF